MKAVIISLHDRPERLSSTLETCKKAGITKPYIFDAYDTRNSGIEHKGFNITRGAIGCTLSHIGVLKMALAMKWSSVLVLEDDINYLGGDWQGIIKTAPADAEVLNFGWKFWNGTQKTIVNDDWQICQSIWGSQANMYTTPEAMKKVIRFFDNWRALQYDGVTQEQMLKGNLKMYHSRKVIFTQNNFPTDIQK